MIFDVTELPELPETDDYYYFKIKNKQDLIHCHFNLELKEIHDGADVFEHDEIEFWLKPINIDIYQEKRFNIDWSGQDKLYGIDYSSKRGIFYDYEFDIRYDCLHTQEKPNCGVFLCIYKSKIRLLNKFADTVDELIKYSDQFLQEEKKKFI